jgi:hypothetical protein
MTGGISPDHLVNTPKIALGVTLLVCLLEGFCHCALYPGSYPLKSLTGAEIAQAIQR